MTSENKKIPLSNEQNFEEAYLYLLNKVMEIIADMEAIVKKTENIFYESKIDSSDIDLL